MVNTDKPHESQDPVSIWQRNVSVAPAKLLLSCRLLATYLAANLGAIILIGAVGLALLQALLLLMVPLWSVSLPGMRLVMIITRNDGVLLPGMRPPLWAYLRAAL
jgi:hypothetical protein